MADCSNSSLISVTHSKHPGHLNWSNIPNGLITSSTAISTNINNIDRVAFKSNYIGIMATIH